MRILFVSANSADAYMDIEREHRTLQQLADAAGHSLRALPAAEIGDLYEALRSADTAMGYDVLHFSGHVSEGRGLELRGKGRTRDILGGDALQELLYGSGVKLVVLNACRSESLATLLSEVVPAAIGTTRKVRDVAARQFARNFYEALMDDVDAGTAFELAVRQQKQSATPAYIFKGNLAQGLLRPARTIRDAGRKRSRGRNADVLNTEV